MKKKKKNYSKPLIASLVATACLCCFFLIREDANTKSQKLKNHFLEMATICHAGYFFNDSSKEDKITFDKWSQQIENDMIKAGYDPAERWEIWKSGHERAKEASQTKKR